MVPDHDRDWWREYRVGLEEALDQDELVVRAQQIERI
jgi:hypothetical protein